MEVTVQVGWRQMLVAVGLIAVGVVVWWASPAVSQTDAPDPVATFAFVARADNPVDALAASSVAGQLGAPVYLTGTDSLDDQARQGLVDSAPQVVVLAGGTAALSVAVEEQIGAVLPAAQIRRFGGAGRTETARLINTLTGELGVDRPVLVGATVAGDVGITGSVTVDGVDVGAALAALAARTETLEADRDIANSRIDALTAGLAAAQDQLDAAQGQIGGLRTDLAAAEGRVGMLEGTLAGVSRNGDTLEFAGMNVQVVNGQDQTDTSNGLGNVIIGYNRQRATPATRTGSHYLVVGDDHEWTAYGGIIAGRNHTASGSFASVSGGERNTAAGSFASVSGGALNTASGSISSVSGGAENAASGLGASVSSGFLNVASGNQASVSGGINNTASGDSTSVAGGRDGTVSDAYDSRIGNDAFPDN